MAGKKIKVAFGAGAFLEHVIKEMPSCEMFDFAVDNDINKHGLTVGGVSVRPVTDIVQYSKENMNVWICVIDNTAINAIKEQLKSLGIVDGVHIISSDHHVQLGDALARLKENEDNQDYGNLNLPSFVKSFERSYDCKSGGYRFPNENYLNFACVEVPVGRFYYALILLLGGTGISCVLETGTNIGYSTIMLAAALKEVNPRAVLYTIDIENFPHIFDYVQDFDNVVFLNGSSINVDLPPDIVIDILVIDSDHSYTVCMNELLRFEPLLKVDGYILMHDTLYYNSVGYCVAQLKDNPRFEVITFETPRIHASGSPGLSVIRKNSANGFPLYFDDSKIKEKECRTGQPPAFRRGYML